MFDPKLHKIVLFSELALKQKRIQRKLILQILNKSGKYFDLFSAQVQLLSQNP
jgi:hypothetical protein